MKKRSSFNYQDYEQEALLKLKQGASLEGKDGVLAPLLKRLLDASLEGEMESYLRSEKTTSPQNKNRRNGLSSKNVKTTYGNIEVVTPRDRLGSFSPEILPKRQTTLGDGLDHKIISLYAMGMSYADICDHLSEMYQIDVSPATLSAITDKIIPLVHEWQNRCLEEIYPVVWLDAIHYKVREDNSIKTKAVYCLIGLTREGTKEILGMYIGESESATFWLSVLNDINHRGVKDIFIASIDNLKGLNQAIKAVFPQTKVQLCVVHQIRNSLKYVPRKDRQDVINSLKLIYQASNKPLAQAGLLQLEERWGNKYPYIIRSWNENWEELSEMFQYPDMIRKLMYTTNIIESFNSQLRKFTKSKRVFTNDMALLKLLYLIQNRVTEKSKTILNWKQIMAQFMIIFEDRWK